MLILCLFYNKQLNEWFAQIGPISPRIKEVCLTRKLVQSPENVNQLRRIFVIIP